MSKSYRAEQVLSDPERFGFMTAAMSAHGQFRAAGRLRSLLLQQSRE